MRDKYLVMKNSLDLLENRLIGPVVIGGVGGSGTRIVAELLNKMGFYLGNDLNSANDNLLFTLLFKRPKWFISVSKKPSVIYKRLSIFKKFMLNHFNLFNKDEINLIISVIISSLFYSHNYLGTGRGLWSYKRFLKIIKTKADLSNYVGWGWKEPNSHIYIKYLNDYFKNFKYIHVIRNGLDMAYSNNQQQLYNWGYLFCVEIPKSAKLLPRASLEYWIKSNKKVISFCRHFSKNNFLLINYDNLCSVPSKEIERLINFLGLEIKNINIIKLCSLIKKPISIGRYKKYDLSIFRKEQIDAVRELGFKVSHY